MVTGIGGGVIRDVLSEVPAVFRTDIYAVAALIGADVVVIGTLSGLPPVPVAAVGHSCASPLAMSAIHRGWHWPVAKRPDKPDDSQRLQFVPGYPCSG